MAVRDRELGIGQIFMDTFSIFFRHIHIFVLLGFVPLVILNLLLGSLLIGSMSSLLMAIGSFQLLMVAGIAMPVIILFTANFIAAGFVVHAAYDAKLGKPLRLGHYVAKSFRQIIPLTVSALIIAIFSAASFFFLILIAAALFGIGTALDTSSIAAWIVIFLCLIPSIWIATVLAVIVPSMVIDQVGFGGVWRSDELTLGYRWQILVLLVLLHLCLVVITALLQGVVETMFFIVDPVANALLQGFVSAVSAGVPFVGIALIYIRLRELKDGKTLEQLAEASM
ncbi:MAG: hypothetical protein HQ481_16390 [Alphaproteobacteria bacterium]|nr:hypothetical protein [Alphaproteobacteria bacterium]